MPEIKKEEVEEEDVAQSEKKVQEPKLTKDEKRKRRRDNLLQSMLCPILFIYLLYLFSF